MSDTPRLRLPCTAPDATDSGAVLRRPYTRWSPSADDGIGAGLDPSARPEVHESHTLGGADGGAACARCGRRAHWPEISDPCTYLKPKKGKHVHMSAAAEELSAEPGAADFFAYWRERGHDPYLPTLHEWGLNLKIWRGDA